MPALITADRIAYASHRSDGSVHLCIASVSGQQPRCAGLLNQSSPVYYQSGRIVFIRGGAVLTRGFDLGQASFTSDEQVLVEEASGGALSGSGLAVLDAASGGHVGFITGQTTERLVWQGSNSPEAPVAEVDATTTMALSPDGSRVLTTDRNTLLLIDFARGTTSKLGTTQGDPIWAPDGERFAHRTAAGIVTRSVADARERVILPAAQTGFPEDWSPDGRWIAVGLREQDFQAVLVPAQGGESVPFVERDGPLARADEFHFSADGRWLAFNAESGGQNEVYVVPVPPTGQRWQVSARGGVQPRWDRDQPRLYYLAPDGTMMAVDISARPAFSASAPRALFDTGLSPAANFDEYRVARDGRFLIKKPIAQSTYRILINWPGLLAARSAGK